jgi:hypothetical protein
MQRAFPVQGGPLDEDLQREGYILASFDGAEAVPVMLEAAGDVGPIRISTLRSAISPQTRAFCLVTTAGARKIANPLSVVDDVTVYSFHAGYTYNFTAGPEPLAGAQRRFFEWRRRGAARRRLCRGSRTPCCCC